MTAPVREIREITDRECWNGLVSGLPQPDLRQGYEWGELRRANGWRARRLAIFAGDECAAAIAILVKKLPLLPQVILYAPAGPVIRDPHDEETWSALMQAIETVAREERAVFLRVDPRLPDEAGWIREALVRHSFHHLPDDWTTWNSPRIVMWMDINEPEAVIGKRIRSRLRSYIRSAASRGISVRPAGPEMRGRDFHTALASAGRRKGLPVRGRGYFEGLRREYLRRDRGLLLVARHKGAIIGGLLGARFGKTAYMLHATQSVRSGVESMHQGPLLYWEFVRWAKKHGCEWIDWGGVGTHYPPRESDPGFGLYLFKRGFNSSLFYLTGYYDRIFSEDLYRAFRFLERSSSAVAWTVRAKLNGTVLLIDDVLDSGERKLRQFRVSVASRGFLTTLYWAAFGFLKPNRFVVLARDLSRSPARPAAAAGSGLEMDVWSATQMAAWRANRTGLSTEFYQNEIDGVEHCVVAKEGDDVAGLIWIYYPGDQSRLFQLRDGEAELNQGFVPERFRNRGVFKKVLDHACAVLTRQGYRMAYAMVHCENLPSLKAFQDVGFEPQGRVRHFLAWRPRFRSTAHAEASGLP